MSEPTADGTGRMLRSVASAMDDGKLDPLHLPRIAGLIRETAAERDRLLALVAAQAEQIAELRGTVRGWRKHCYDAWAERDAIRAELHALHATDDFQRWARAVVERDAAREQVGRVRALHTPNDPPSSTYAKECMGCDGYWPCETARALDGGAAT